MKTILILSKVAIKSRILKNNFFPLLLLSVFYVMLSGFSSIPYKELAPTGLMIENHRNDAEPILISDDQPEFSWIVNDKDDNEYQTAYRLIIATSQKLIDQNKGDFYDSKKVKSNQSINIRYKGPGFKSGTAYFWKVKTWDKDNKDSEWSRSGQFVKALATKDWKAKPIWCSANDDYTFLRKTVVPENKEILSAYAFVTGRHTEGQYPRPVMRGGKQYTFKFYVNDELVGIGPYRFREDNQYALFDITKYLKAGLPNVLGSINKSTRKEKDFMCQVQILYKDGSEETIVTDDSWKALPAQEIFNPTGNTAGEEGDVRQYYFNPYEEVDGTKWPSNWKASNFDDSKWEEARLMPMYEVRPGQIRNIKFQKMPIEVKKLNDTDYEIITDVHTCGWIELKLEEGATSEIFTVYYPEEEKDAKSLTWRTDKGAQTLEEFGYVWRKNIIIKDYTGPELTEDNIDYYAIGAAFDPEDTKFTSSNDLLNDIFRICKASMEYNNIDIYMDSPTRQRSPFPGDGVINMRTHYSMSRDYGVGKYSMEYFLPMMYGIYPEYGVQIINQAFIDYMFTGSTKFMETHYESLKQRENKDGNYLYYGKWIGIDALVDHPNGYKDDYDYDASPDNVVHSWSYGALRDLATIAGILGEMDDRDHYNALADKLYKEYNETFWNPENGLYKDGGNSDHYSIHANFFPTATGLVSEEKQESVADYLRTKPMNCNVYGAQFFWDALYKMDEGDKAMDLMLSKDTRSYYNMIYVMNSTTAAETWDRTNLTRSHPWGSAGGNLIVGSIMGIHALAPGFAKIGIKPQTSNLKEAAIDFMTIRGNVHMEIELYEEEYHIQTETPANTSSTVYVPVFSNTNNDIKVDGKMVQGKREGNYIIFENLGSGIHVFERKI